MSTSSRNCRLRPDPNLTTRHGVLMAMYGCGVFLTGDSGTGKSELALRLIRRGHALVADDAPAFECHANRWIGRASDALHGRLQLRGIGVINVPSLLGPAAIQASTPVDLLIELTRTPETDARPLSGSRPRSFEFLGTTLPGWSIPVETAPASPELIETAVLAAGLHRKAAETTGAATWN